jgi:hypothetical protein
MTDFKEKQIEKLLTAIAKLEGQSGQAVELVRLKHEGRVEALELALADASKKAAARFQQKIDVLEKQLKALGGSR